MTTTQGIEFKDPAIRAMESAEELRDMQGEKMVLNLGPSHPATHGVLRIVLELDGEIITKAVPDVGYLHRGDEKNRREHDLHPVHPLHGSAGLSRAAGNNVAYALAVEKLLGIHDKLPPRCQYIRVICCELARISSHLLGLGAFGLDLGAVTVFLLTFTEREKNLQPMRITHRRAISRQATRASAASRATRRPAGATPSANFSAKSSSTLPRWKRCSRAIASGWIARVMLA
jgi:NADH-quinone oxidoreductase subunit D